MQRNCDVTVIRQIMNKYQQRYNECDEQWNNDINELKEVTDQERKDWLLSDVTSLNAQMSAYECIIKDLKGIIE